MHKDPKSPAAKSIDYMNYHIEPPERKLTPEELEREFDKIFK